MKKTLSFLLIITMLIGTLTVTSAAAKKHYFEGTDEIVKMYTDEAYALIDEIVESPTEVSVSGISYYVSTSGNDSNDGRSPSTAWATLYKVNSANLNAGDAVFFKRGDKWNGSLAVKNGVTYSAYGTGKKPLINGTTDASDYLDWLPTDNENIYKYALPLPSPASDVGKIIFDNGDAWGVKVLKLPNEDKRADNAEAYNGLEYFTAGTGKFKNGFDLKYDLEFYHDPDERSLYLYSKGSHPADRFDTIELVTHINGISGGNTNILIDNLEIRGFGAHGISVTNAKNYRVQNCVLNWIGGSISNYNENTRPTRYGNAIQNWSNCDGFFIDHCYSYQIFDCCYTTQWQGDPGGKSVIMTNIKFTNNVAMYANTGLEIWCQSKVKNPDCEYSVKNMTMSGNYNLYMGYGMTSDRTADKKDANLIYGSTFTGSNNSTDNNVLLFSDSMIFYSSTIGPNTYNFHDNIYIVNEGTLLGRISANTGEDSGGTKSTPLTKETVAAMIASGADFGSRYYVVPNSDLYTVPEYNAPDILANYSDIGSHWSRDNIKYVVNRGYFQGVSTDKFSPDGTMTRAMAITVLMRISGGATVESALPYTDVMPGAWYENSIKWAYENKVIEHGDKFRPDDNITREELADMLYRVAMLTGRDGNASGTLSFTDADSISPDYSDGLAFCTEAGIIGGYSDGTVKPKNGATRAEVSTMIKRFDKYLSRTPIDKNKIIARSDFQKLTGEELSKVLDTSFMRKNITDSGSIRFTTFGNDAELNPSIRIMNDLLDGFNMMKYPYVVIKCKSDLERTLNTNIRYSPKSLYCWPESYPSVYTESTSVLLDLTAFIKGSGLPASDAKDITLILSPFGQKHKVNPANDLFEIEYISFYESYDAALASLDLET